MRGAVVRGGVVRGGILQLAVPAAALTATDSVSLSLREVSAILPTSTQSRLDGGGGGGGGGEPLMSPRVQCHRSPAN